MGRRPCRCARHGGERRFAPRGACRGIGMPSMNMAAHTNPKAKMTPKMRYVHSNRISGHILRGSRRNPGRKSRWPGAGLYWNAASRLPGRPAGEATRCAFQLSLEACRPSPGSPLWMTQSGRACSSIGRTRRCPAEAASETQAHVPRPPVHFEPQVPPQSPNVRPWSPPSDRSAPCVVGRGIPGSGKPAQ
jgi:hypothetical protein